MLKRLGEDRADERVIKLLHLSTAVSIMTGPTDVKHCLCEQRENLRSFAVALQGVPLCRI